MGDRKRIRRHSTVEVSVHGRPPFRAVALGEPKLMHGVVAVWLVRQFGGWFRFAVPVDAVRLDTNLFHWTGLRPDRREPRVGWLWRRSLARYSVPTLTLDDLRAQWPEGS